MNLSSWDLLFCCFHGHGAEVVFWWQVISSDDKIEDQILVVHQGAENGRIRRRAPPVEQNSKKRRLAQCSSELSSGRTILRKTFRWCVPWAWSSRCGGEALACGVVTPKSRRTTREASTYVVPSQIWVETEFLWLSAMSNPMWCVLFSSTMFTNFFVNSGGDIYAGA